MGLFKRGLWVAAALALAASPVQAAERWHRIFDGKTLNGWTPKIVGHPFGDNFQNTFVVEDGAIRVSYAGYDTFANRFGHLIYKTPFKAYRLRLKYRVLDPGAPGAPAWAHSNSGVMFHGQPGGTMALNQPFPVSFEFQILGPDGPGARPTGNVCSPGTNIVLNGVMAKDHCNTSSGPTIPNGVWTDLELEVTPAGEAIHRINGKVVMRYSGLELDPTDPTAKPLIETAGGKLALTQGYISLQSEGHPIAFKDIEVQEIVKANPAP